MVINVKASSKTYSVFIEKGSLSHIKDYISNLDRKVLIVTDSNIPLDYVETIKNQLENAYVFTFKAGEISKNFDTYKDIIQTLFDNSFSRKDCIIALGGGVTGDMAGFAAATYMRGIEFFNIPTTLLSMVDSSIGGKTAIDLNGVKNIVGAFYPPSAVIIDVNVLSTLPTREINAGLAESIKMSLTSNEDLFNLIESSKRLSSNIEKIIYESLLVKKFVVENDETERGLRRILNFGHTIGHAIETLSNGNLLHGECVALGMLYVSSNQVKERLIPLLEKYNLPTTYNGDKNALMDLIKHDKKAYNNKVSLITVKEIGYGRIEEVDLKDLEDSIL